MYHSHLSHQWLWLTELRNIILTHMDHALLQSCLHIFSTLFLRLLLAWDAEGGHLPGTYGWTGKQKIFMRLKRCSFSFLLGAKVYNLVFPATWSLQLRLQAIFNLSFWSSSQLPCFNVSIHAYGWLEWCYRSYYSSCFHVWHTSGLFFTVSLNILHPHLML